MKKLSVCFVLCSILWSATCSAAEVDTSEVKSEVSAVNVFFQGARVNREAPLNLSSGKHVLSVSGLPPLIDPKLIEVKTPNRLKILALSHQVKKPSQRSTRSEVKLLEDQRSSLEENIEWLKAKREVYDEEEALLVQNTELKKADGETHTLGVRQAADFYRERLIEIAELKFDNTLAIRKAQKEIKEINSEMNSLLAGTQVSQMELLILVEASGLVSGNLNVEYFTNAAGWEPLYDFRFDAVNKPLELVYNANVYQSTGEDWNEVKLSLTEGMPKQKTSLPEFDRWYITRRPSAKASSTGSQQKGTGTLKGTLTDSQTEEPLPFVNVVLQQGSEQIIGTATDFEGRYTIKPIQSGQYDVQVNYVGYNAKRIEGVRINADKITFLDIGLDSAVKLETFEIAEYSVPSIDRDGGASGSS
ncbi:MAG: mucoidy inhibitor MuiA family protein, partial [Cryomorphaceae bacterium]